MLNDRPFIDSEWLEPFSCDHFETQNLFSGLPWARIPRGNASDVERAASAAAKAFEGPRSTYSASERGKILYRLGALVEENARHLAAIEYNQQPRCSRPPADVCSPSDDGVKRPNLRAMKYRRRATELRGGGRWRQAAVSPPSSTIVVPFR